jgi:hypothetical protein
MKWFPWTGEKGHWYDDNGTLFDNPSAEDIKRLNLHKSVTEIIGYLKNKGITDWSINQNVLYAYKLSNLAADMEFERFRSEVHAEERRANNHADIGKQLHSYMELAISEAISLSALHSHFLAFSGPGIKGCEASIRMAYQWLLSLHPESLSVEKTVADCDSGVYGTIDVLGKMRFPNQTQAQLTVIDWKGKFIKKHPGFKKDGITMKTLPIENNKNWKIQVGGYSKAVGALQGAVCAISVNPIVPGIKVFYYNKEDVLSGYKVFGYLYRTVKSYETL